MTNLTRTLMATAAAATFAATGAAAQDASMKQNARARQSADAPTMNQKWAEMREEAIRATELMDGNYSNGLNPVAEIGNLVLNEDATAVEYIVYRSNTMPYELYVGDGYTTFDAVELQTGDFNYGVDVRAENDADDVRGPDTLRISAEEAERRLVSTIIESPIRLGGGTIHEIEDMLIDPETGAVTHFVIGTDEGVLFSGERRAIRATQVEFENGEYSTDLKIAQIEQKQPYDPGLL